MSFEIIFHIQCMEGWRSYAMGVILGRWGGDLYCGFLWLITQLFNPLELLLLITSDFLLQISDLNLKEISFFIEVSFNWFDFFSIVLFLVLNSFFDFKRESFHLFFVDVSFLGSLIEVEHFHHFFNLGLEFLNMQLILFFF